MNVYVSWAPSHLGLLKLVLFNLFLSFLLSERICRVQRLIRLLSHLGCVSLPPTRECPPCAAPAPALRLAAQIFWLSSAWHAPLTSFRSCLSCLPRALLLLPCPPSLPLCPFARPPPGMTFPAFFLAGKKLPRYFSSFLIDARHWMAVASCDRHPLLSDASDHLHDIGGQVFASSCGCHGYQ